MRVLLVGDYSNVHATLARGLRELGHEAVLVSDGDGWKNYPRDVDVRRPGMGKVSSLIYYLRLRHLWRTMRGYDVVQIINPCFLPLRAERIWPFYKYLRKHNKKVFLGAYGMDHYWVKAGLDCRTFRYSDFNIGAVVRTDVAENEQFIADWLHGPKGELNLRIEQDCDGVVAGLYEYFAAYDTYSPRRDVLRFIPFPIVPSECHNTIYQPGEKVRFFLGIQKARTAYKGTDIMGRALMRLVEKYPDKAEAVCVENVPFEQYRKLMRSCHVILDQLYSYTPAMNALEAMAQGLIAVGGAEPENYDILSENTLRPIINVAPNEESVYEMLEHLVLNPDLIPSLRSESLEYIRRHHHYIVVAQKYIDTWSAAAAHTAM